MSKTLLELAYQLMQAGAGLQPVLRIVPARHSHRDHRHHDRCPLEAGPTFLHGKAISCHNPYVAQVQAVAPRFQGVPKQVPILSQPLKNGKEAQCSCPKEGLGIPPCV